MKRKAAQTKPKKLIRCTCPSGHESDGSGPKWHAPPCSESAAQKKSYYFHSLLRRNYPGAGPE